MSKYPCIGESGSLKGHKDSECEACKSPATHRLRIQEDYMRGNDEVVIVCPRHRKIADKSIRQLYAHIHSKEKFFAKKEKSA